jgi:hypothetical protein
MFLMSVKDVIIFFRILDSIFKFSGKKSMVYHWLGIDTDPNRSDPDPHALDADADPAK